METFMDRVMQPGILVPFFIFGLPVLAWAIKGAFSAQAKARIAEAEIQLKRDLVSQGRSAEEIDRIMSTARREKLNG
jgi:hypothetical protein